MPSRFQLAVVLALLAACSPAATAHYHMLLPQPASARRGQEVSVLYQWGHPFEHQLFDASAPRRLVVIDPDGKKTDLTRSLEKVTATGAEGKRVTAFRLRFTPRKRGDFVFVLDAGPVWMAEERVFFEDTVKATLHVQDQDGWDAAGGADFELSPLTRPYGLQPGMVFQAQVAAGGKPAAGTLVEVERYNPAPPEKLPPDEQITRTAKTDPGGVVTCTLTEPGWWCLTALRAGGKKERLGKAYPVRQRTTFWVFVDEKAGPGAGR